MKFLTRLAVFADLILSYVEWFFGGDAYEPKAPVTPELPLPEAPAPEPTEPTPAPKRDLLRELCLSIREYEGWAPGTRSFRNNNPGNCRYSSVGYASIYKPVLKDPQNFAVFKDYATGWLYLQNLIKSKAAAHPTWTILDLMKEYAPSTDGNDPGKYAAFLRNRIGVDSTFEIQHLL